MATTLLTLLDDLTLLLDDVAVLSQVAVKKTAGVIGDDLALNAEQVTGMQPARELPVIWAVAKGALLNKVILVPVALAISAFAPKLIIPLLMLGGLVLCYEGFGKIWTKLQAAREPELRKARLEAVATSATDMVAFERDRIKGAIRTDFILSAEIIVIALGTMAAAPIMQQIVSLSAISVGITVLVYGLVAGLVKLDDAGLQLQRAGGSQRALGAVILRTAPRLMQALSVLGTAAMFMVGGSIVVHGVPMLERAVQAVVGGATGLLGFTLRTAGDATIGIIAGGVVYALLLAGGRARAAIKR